MKEHKHAEFLRAIADGEKVTDWEDQGCSGIKSKTIWFENLGGIILNPELYTIRRKPKTITRTISYPEPMSVVPEINVKYWCATTDRTYRYHLAWRNDDYDQRVFDLGLCHATEEAAIAHGKAMAGVSDE